MNPALRIIGATIGPELINPATGPMGANFVQRGTITSLGGRHWRLATTSLSGALGGVTATATPLLADGKWYEAGITVSARSVTNATNTLAIFRSQAQNSGVDTSVSLIAYGVGTFKGRFLATATLDTLTLLSGQIGGAAVVGDTWDFEFSLRVDS